MNFVDDKIISKGWTTLKNRNKGKETFKRKDYGNKHHSQMHPGVFAPSVSPPAFEISVLAGAFHSPAQPLAPYFSFQIIHPIKGRNQNTLKHFQQYLYLLITMESSMK